MSGFVRRFRCGSHHWCGLRFGLDCGRLYWSRGRHSHGRLLDGCDGLFLLVLVDLLFEVSENVIQHKVAIGLFGEKECLSEFPPRLVVVRHFTNDEDDDAAVGRGLGVDRVDVDFTLVVADGGDAVVNFLQKSVSFEELSRAGPTTACLA